jgi:hypothetical protein
MIGELHLLIERGALFPWVLVQTSAERLPSCLLPFESAHVPHQPRSVKFNSFATKVALAIRAK